MSAEFFSHSFFLHVFFFLNNFSKFLFVEKTELGYAYTAKAHSEETHHLPPPPNAFGEKNFNRVLYNITKFMRADGVPVFDRGNPFVFTYNDPLSNEGNQIEVLKDFLNQFAEPKTPNIDVYPLTRLFFVLRTELAKRGKCESIPNENFTNVLLSRDPYETTGGISCEVSIVFQCNSTKFRDWSKSLKKKSESFVQEEESKKKTFFICN